jgi:hypothetical protein
LPDLGEALEAGRLDEARVEREAVEADRVQLEWGRDEVRAELKESAQPSVQGETQRLSDIDVRLAAPANLPDSDPATLAVLAEAMVEGRHEAD